MLGNVKSHYRLTLYTKPDWKMTLAYRLQIYCPTLKTGQEKANTEGGDDRVTGPSEGTELQWSMAINVLPRLLLIALQASAGNHLSWLRRFTALQQAFPGAPKEEMLWCFIHPIPSAGPHLLAPRQVCLSPKRPWPHIHTAKSEEAVLSV